MKQNVTRWGSCSRMVYPEILAKFDKKNSSTKGNHHQETETCEDVVQVPFNFCFEYQKIRMYDHILTKAFVRDQGPSINRI